MSGARSGQIGSLDGGKGQKLVKPSLVNKQQLLHTTNNTPDTRMFFSNFIERNVAVKR